jgi:phenylacetate-CoA ligase
MRCKFSTPHRHQLDRQADVARPWEGRMNALDAWRLAAMLTRTDRLAPDIDRLVEAKFRRLLRHAARTVPWYARLCREAGIVLDRAGLDVLDRLPITRREHWTEQRADEFRSTAVNISRCRWIRTSGTTGIPVAMPYVFEDRVMRRMGTQRCFWAAGAGIRDRYVWIRAARRHPRSRPRHERLGLLPTLHLDLLSPPDGYWDAVRSWAPRGLLGYPLETETIAAWVEEGRLGRLPGPVICGLYGEPLEPASRRRIEAAFGPTRTMYGSTEGGTIAWECGLGPGLHVNADLVIVEFLRDGRRVAPGTPGEVVITNLHSWAMPVIRYGQGDVGWEVPGPCPCGRPGPRMEVEPTFRLGPLRLPSGRRISARFFIHAIPDPSWLARWSAEQLAPDLLRLTLTARRPVPREEREEIAAAVARACWEPVRVEVECRPEAPTRPGGRAAAPAPPAWHGEKECQA